MCSRNTFDDTSQHIIYEIKKKHCRDIEPKHTVHIISHEISIRLGRNILETYELS